MITKDGPSGWFGTNYNVGEVALYGFEVNAEVFPLDGLTLRADYTYEEARNQTDGKVTDHVTNVPKHKLDLEVQYQVPVVKTRFNINMTCVGETYSELPTPQYPTDPELIAGEYTIFGAKISQPFLEHFEAFVAAKNIFDKNYEPEVGYPAPGRSFWVGLSATF
jgi:outer membrane receptor protein involved in Fe transport